jgi:hypothetical protein
MIRAAMALALAAGAAAGADRYPFPLSLEAQQAAEEAKYIHPQPGVAVQAPNPESLSELGQQAEQAYYDLAKNRFSSGPGGLVLQLVQVTGSIEQGTDGWRAQIEHDLILHVPEGEELARYHLVEWSLIEGPGEAAIPNAFERAANFAAQRFESEMERPEKVAAWLSAHGVVPGSIPRRLPAHERPNDPLERHVRGNLVAYLDLGGAFHLANSTLNSTATTTTAKGAESTVELSEVRLGAATRWLFVQGFFSRYSSALENERSSMSTTLIGGEAGVLVRLQDRFELAAGAGAEFVDATATDPQQLWVTRRTVVPDAIVAVRWTPLIGTQPFRVSFDARVPFSSVEFLFADSPGGPRVTRDVSMGPGFAVMIGTELMLRKP